MKKAHLLIALFTAAALAMSSLPAFPANSRGIRIVTRPGNELFLYKDYQALVVGISDYDQWPKLPYAANDAKEVAQRLRQLGFQVKLVIDPTSDELKKSMSEMTYQMGREKDT